jgi:hypothetical protein
MRRGRSFSDNPITSKGEFDTGIRSGGEFFWGEDRAQGGKVYAHLDEEKEHDARTWVKVHLGP